MADGGNSKLAELATDLAVRLERACDPGKMVRFQFLIE